MVLKRQVRANNRTAVRVTALLEQLEDQRITAGGSRGLDAVVEITICVNSFWNEQCRRQAPPWRSSERESVQTAASIAGERPTLIPQPVQDDFEPPASY